MCVFPELESNEKAFHRVAEKERRLDTIIKFATHPPFISLMQRSITKVSEPVTLVTLSWDLDRVGFDLGHRGTSSVSLELWGDRLDRPVPVNEVHPKIHQT